MDGDGFYLLGLQNVTAKVVRRRIPGSVRNNRRAQKSQGKSVISEFPPRAPMLPRILSSASILTPPGFAGHLHRETGRISNSPPIEKLSRQVLTRPRRRCLETPRRLESADPTPANS